MIHNISTLIGGLGLLLVGMNLLTEGLKLASGNALRDLLATWTNTRVRGLMAGFLITGIVQSSSAVSVATIGFANAGMLKLPQAVWVIYGSNVGTTLTAWIVALIGFELDIAALALPLIGCGALLKFTGANTRRDPGGMALVGFGLLLLGIATLKTAFESAGSDFSLPATADAGPLHILLYVVLGFILTTLMQSSTAAMVITLSAAQGGLIPLDAACAVVIGANLGTTSTALLSSLGSTSTAKRVAWSHVLFNLSTACVAIFLLGPMLWLVQVLEQVLGLMPTAALSLAVFHTLFNVCGVLLMWPLSTRLIAWLEQHFTTSEDTEVRFHHLDQKMLVLPLLATDALALEISRVNQHTIAALQHSLKHNEELPHSSLEHRIVRKLADAIGTYSVELTRRELPPELSKLLADLIESTQQYLLVIDIAEDIGVLSRDAQEYFPAEVNTALEDYLASINRHLDIQNLGKPELNRAGNASYEEVELYYRKLKDRILQSAANGDLDMDKLDRLLQYINQAKRACRQMLKATQRLLKVRAVLQRGTQDSGTPADPQSPPGITTTQE